METKTLLSIKVTIGELLEMFLQTCIMENSGFEFNSWANSIPSEMLNDKEVIHLFLKRTLDNPTPAS